MNKTRRKNGRVLGKDLGRSSHFDRASFGKPSLVSLNPHLKGGASHWVGNNVGGSSGTT